MYSVDDHAKALLQLAVRLGSALSRDQVCQAIITQAIDTLGAYGGGVLLLHPHGGSLEVVASFGFSSSVMDRSELLPLTLDVPATDVFRSGQDVFLHSPEEWNRRYAEPLAASSLTTSAAALLLQSGASRIGVLTLAFKTPMAFSARDRVFAATLAAQCAQALERAALYDRERAARAEAERAGRAKDDFLATLSHELRTPINAVLGWARLLRSRSVEAATVEKGLESIERNSLLQARLIGDMLDMSRITSGTLSLDVHDTDLGSLVESAVDHARPAARARGVTLVTSIEPSLGVVPADADRVMQAVGNLLSNAVKFTPAGGTVMTTLDRLGNSARITVTDTGMGIDPGLLAHVFERHRSFEPGPKRDSGLGLGLAIVRHIVERHGGSVSARSDGPGQGASFTIRLPLATTDRDDAMPPLPQGGGVTRRLDGIRIMLVEDDADSREVETRLLSAHGAHVRPYATAAEAWSALLEDRPDVLIADIGLPDEDGYSLLRRLRAMEDRRGWARLPGIALTALANADARRTAMLAGFNIHLTKPFEIDALVASVHDMAARSA